MPKNFKFVKLQSDPWPPLDERKVSWRASMTTIERLDLQVPNNLEKTLGYKGKSRWVAFYGDPGVGPFLKDRWDSIFIANETWKVLLQNFFPKRCNLYGNDWLLLDRVDRNLYMGKKSFINEFLEQPQTQKMLLLLDKERPTRLGRLANAIVESILVFGGLAIISAIVACLLGLLGYGLFQTGYDIFLRSFDQAEIYKPPAQQYPQVEYPKPVPSSQIPEQESFAQGSEAQDTQSGRFNGLDLLFF